VENGVWRRNKQTAPPGRNKEGELIQYGSQENKREDACRGPSEIRQVTTRERDD